MFDDDADGGLTGDEISAAIELLIARMDVIDARCADGFPLYSCGARDQWIVAPGGSWTGGFWAGWWWLRARATASGADRRRAMQICRRLSPKIHAASINRSMIFWHGAALGDVWCGDREARRMARDAAAALAASYDPAMQCIPLGTAMGGGADGGGHIDLDTLAAVVGLLGYRDRGPAADIARRHVDTACAACGTAEGAYCSRARYRRGVFLPLDRAGAWSRGQAWAMFGLGRAARRWGQPYLRRAQQACAYWLRSRPEPLPPDRLDRPCGHRDSSAALIAALAMLSLAGLVPDPEPWSGCARRQIAAVVRSRYFTGLRGVQDGIAPGIYWGACYRTGAGRHEPVEAAWSSFFLMAALCILGGIIAPAEC